MSRNQVRDPKQRAAYHKKLMAYRKGNKLCIHCGKPDELNGCVACLKCREKAKARGARNKAEGRCYCGRERKENYSICSNCLNHQRPSQARHLKNQSSTYKSRQTALKTQRTLAMKKEVFEAYGNKCACCGETNQAFFQIDHVFGGGCKHRKEISRAGGYMFYLWLKERGFPQKEFQLLCASCNWGKRDTGICPHKALLVVP